MFEETLKRQLNNFLSWGKCHGLNQLSVKSHAQRRNTVPLVKLEQGTFRSESPKGFTVTLQETRRIHDSTNSPKIEFIAYIYISL